MKGCPIPLSVEALMAKSRDIAGVDLIDHAAIEPLTVMHRALCEEAQLHEQGALAQQNKLLRLLANRLRMQRDFLRHPEIAEQQIKGPLVVIGVPRSGTTKTQKILAATGDFNWLPFWQAYNWASFSGAPGEPTQQRIREADEYCRWFDRCSPENRLGHPWETFEPEEDTVLTEGSLVAPSFQGYAEVPSYLQWFMGQPPAILFEFLRDAMKYLQWQGLASASKTWLLKGPMYSGLEPVILKVFPDARLVFAHRSPVDTQASACKLLTCLRLPFSDKPPEVTPTAEGFVMSLLAHVANRKAHPDLPLLDIGFKEVTTDMPTVVNKIYAHAGLTLTDQSRRRMAQWEADHPIHKNGRFKYSLEEFDLSAETLTARLADYLALQEALGLH